ncbi:MAG TPA: PAS domain-containing protein, partial [Thermodesulfobacteriota bacterium]|nr:PAS domain-containing protein [Thermodesulfobacteriota bacterium]
MTKKINFEEIFDSLPESIIIIDKELRVLDINDNAESTFRISREKARGQRSKVFMPEEIDRVALMAMGEGRTVIGDEIKPTLRSGERISIQAVASPIFTQEGDLKGAILQIKDKSGTNFLSSKSIQEISAAKFENLVLGLAHELKNPL